MGRVAAADAEAKVGAATAELILAKAPTVKEADAEAAAAATEKLASASMPTVEGNHAVLIVIAAQKVEVEVTVDDGKLVAAIAAVELVALIVVDLEQD